MTSEAMEKVLRDVVAEFRADMGTIHLLEENDGALHLAALVGNIPVAVRAAVEIVPIGKGIAGEAAHRREPVSICNIQQDTSGVTRPGAKTIGTQGALCVPMLAGNRLVGTLGVGCNGERTFTEEETQRMMEIGKRLAEEMKPSP